MPYKFSFYFTFCCLSLLLNFKVYSQDWETFKISLFKDQNIEIEVLFKSPKVLCDSNSVYRFKYKRIGKIQNYPLYINWKMEYEDCDGYTFVKFYNVEIGDTIGGYDDGTVLIYGKDPTFRAKKIKRNFYDVQVSYVPVDSSYRHKILTPFQLQENAIWQNAVNNPTVSNVEYYINSYQNGAYINEAKVLLPKAYFSLAQSKDNYSAENICSSIPSDSAYVYWKKYYVYSNNSQNDFNEARTRIFLYEFNAIKKSNEASIQKKIDLINSFNQSVPNNLCFSQLQEQKNLLTIYLNAKNKPSPILANLLIPGRGNKLINRDLRLIHSKSIVGKLFETEYDFHARFAYLTTIAVCGSLITSGYFFYQANSNYNQYNNSTNPAEWDGYLNLANDNRLLGNTFLGVGLGIWVLDFANILYKQHKIKKALTHIDKNVVGFKYHHDTFLLNYTYNF